MNTSSLRTLRLAAILAAALTTLPFATPAQAQTTSSDVSSLPAGVQDVIKLTQAGLGEDVIIAKLQNSGTTYDLSTDQIISLANQGVSQNVIKTLIGGRSAASPAPAPIQTPAVAVPPAAPEVPSTTPAPVVTDEPAVSTPAATAPGPNGVTADFDSFQQQLSPYGQWVQLAGYGTVWRPGVAVANPGWRPYVDGGNWVYTDDGWYWQSEYTWGKVPFHYGRWYRDYTVGWVWVPDYTWGPAWVAWRQDAAEGFCGWAPLPPGVRAVAGAGLYFNGRLVVGDFDFGLGADAFFFIGFDHFWDHDYRPFGLPRERAFLVYRHSAVLTAARWSGGRFVAVGFTRERIAVLTHRPVSVVGARDLRVRDEHRVVVSPDRRDGRVYSEQDRRAVPARGPVDQQHPVAPERRPDPNAKQTPEQQRKDYNDHQQ